MALKSINEIAFDRVELVSTAVHTQVNDTVLFTIAGGPIIIEDLITECISANAGSPATTIQWRSNPTVGTATTISGATATLASFVAGGTIRLAPTALSTTPVSAVAGAGGVQLGTNVANKITVQPGTIQLVVGAGSNTGTWKTYLRYRPLASGVTVI